MRDPIEQLTTVILPKLITKVKELKEQNTQLQEAFVQMSKDFADVLAEHKHDIVTFKDEVTAKLDAMQAAPKPKRTRKKKEEPAPVETPVDDVPCDEKPAKPAPKPKVTGTDLLYANYALCACKGNIAEARMCEPSIDAETYEYIAGLSTSMIQDICTIYPPEGDGTIDMRYASANWKELL